MPELLPTPDHRTTTIVVGTSVRKNCEILQPFLASLAWQDLPPRTELIPVFVPDWPQKDAAEDYLRHWVAERGGECIRGVPTTAGDFADTPNFDAHQWGVTAMRRVGANKNRILLNALARKADAVWLVDADLILDRTTLRSLLAAEKPLTTAVYWTHWSKRGFETRQIHAAPQVWLGHPYNLAGRGMDEAEFRQKLINRELTRVWGFGACTLIQRKVLEAGINFDTLRDVPQEGLMAGEDRHFSIAAERAHIDAYADPWPDIFHIYHADQHVPLIPEMATRLGTEHPKTAQLGDLVSLKLEALEPVPHGNGQWQAMPRQHVRGRLGQVPLMPELEEAVYALSRGETRIVPVHFPIHHPLAYFRGRRRLIRLTLVDVKPFGWPPVLDAELFVGPRSGRWMDTTTLTTQQLEGMKEVALAS
jgi:hypothetical protein